MGCRVIGILALMLILGACSDPTADTIAEAKSNPTDYYVIHEPDAGCPKEWAYLRHAFTENSGNEIDGCRWDAIGGDPRVAREVHLDVLQPGESFDAGIWSLPTPYTGVSQSLPKIEVQKLGNASCRDSLRGESCDLPTEPPLHCSATDDQGIRTCTAGVP